MITIQKIKIDKQFKKQYRKDMFNIVIMFSVLFYVLLSVILTSNNIFVSTIETIFMSWCILMFIIRLKETKNHYMHKTHMANLLKAREEYILKQKAEEDDSIEVEYKVIE